MNAPYVESKREFTDETGRLSTMHGRRRRAVWVALAVLLVGLVVWLVRPSSSVRNNSGGIDNSPIPVGASKAQRGDIHIRVDALGRVTPLATVTVTPEVSGIIQKIDFRDGQMVRAGAVLAEIDPRPHQAALDHAKGALARDAAQYANAQIDLKRYRSLWAQTAISQQILATQEALVRTDAETVEADKAAVEAAAVNLGFCKITSPVGALLALMITGTEFTLLALIGVLLLIGIVKKNAIMMIDFALDAERTEGLSSREAIYKACLMHFRPIMMTTFAAILGSLPLALGLGSGFSRSLGISIVGGLMVSQLLTLFTTPVVYLYLDGFRLRCRSAWQRLRPGSVAGSDQNLEPA